MGWHAREMNQHIQESLARWSKDLCTSEAQKKKSWSMMRWKMLGGGQGLAGHEVFSRVMERIEELLTRKDTIKLG